MRRRLLVGSGLVVVAAVVLLYAWIVGGGQEGPDTSTGQPAAASVPSTVPEAAPATTAPDINSIPADDGVPAVPFPTPDTTGPRVPYSALEASGDITSSHDGQVIEKVDVTGNIRILHDDVTVRDARIRYTSTYGLNVRKRDDGSCPEGTVFEHVEVDGQLAPDNYIPVYSPGCGWTLDHAYVHDVGRVVRLVSNNTVTNSYILADRGGDSGAHRGAVGLNGGSNHIIRNNVLICDTPKGCSAALTMYGDTAPVEDVLVEHNLIAATAAYCAYGGSVDSKAFPEASEIRFVDNHFSTRFFDDCGRSGPITGFERDVRGNVWEGNVWHETGEVLP